MRRSALLALPALMLACSDPVESGEAVHCVLDTGACELVSKSAFTADDLVAIEAWCTAEPGTYGTGACPGTAIPGFCAFGDFQAATSVTVSGASLNEYFYDPTTGAGASLVCNLAGGTWFSPDPGPAAMSCDYGDGSCVQYNGTFSADDAALIQAICQGLGYTYAAAGCPVANRVAGYCDGGDPGIGSGTTRDYYYTPTWDETTAAADCGPDWVYQ